VDRGAGRGTGSFRAAGPGPGFGGPDVRLLDADDLCRLWKVRKGWLYDAVERGEVPCLRLGNQLRFRPADLAAYLDQHPR
jgi:excisionase family DNA binding protein